MTLLAIVCCGTGLVAVGFPSRAASRPEALFRVAAGAAIGFGVSSAWFAARLMASGHPPGRVDQALLCAAGISLWAVFGRKARGERGPIDAAPRWLWALFALACAVAAAAFVEHTLRFPDGGWDAWMIWNVRARFLARAADFRTAFSPDLLYMTHQGYPWLLPGAVAQGFLAAGETPMVPVIISALFGILAVAVVSFGLASREGTRWGLLAGLAVLTFPRFVISWADQQSDMPLAVYVALACLLLPASSARELWLAGVVAGLGVWTKNEGSLYAAALAGAFFIRNRNPRGALAFAAGALPFAALLFWFKVTLAPPNALRAFSTGASLLRNATDLQRWGELLLLTLRRLVYFQDFALWLVAAIAVAIFFARRGPFSPVGVALAAACAAFGVVYVLQPFELDWIFRTSVNRLVAQLWPAVLVAAIPALRRYASVRIETPRTTR
jgi:4-amino-4-deoxy-L-arabinose transferase-like glycosyltransferase